MLAQQQLFGFLHCTIGRQSFTKKENKVEETKMEDNRVVEKEEKNVLFISHY